MGGGRGAALLSIVAWLLLLGTACSHRSAPLNQFERRVTVDLYNDRIQPAQLTLSTGTVVDARVNNHGSRSCSFSMGDYVKAVNVPAGAHRNVRFTVDTPSGNPTSVEATMSMGCAGVEAQQGSLVVQFTGLHGGQ